VQAARTRRQQKAGLIKPQRPAIEVRDWDFHVQDGLDRFGMTVTRQMAESLVKTLSTRATTWARSRIVFGLARFEQCAWQDLVQSATQWQSLAATSSLDNGVVVIYLPARTALTLLDIYLGGQGTAAIPERQLTDVETQLAMPLFMIVMEAMREVATSLFGNVQTGAVNLLKGNTNLLFIGAHRQVAVCDLQHEDTPPISIGIPVETIRPLVDRLVQTTSGAHVSAETERAAGRVPLRLSLRYRPVHVPMSVVEGLKVGQVLSLGHPIDQPLTLAIEGREVFSALPVDHNKRIGAKIVRHASSLDAKERDA